MFLQSDLSTTLLDPSTRDFQKSFGPSKFMHANLPDRAGLWSLTLPARLPRAALGPRRLNHADTPRSPDLPRPRGARIDRSFDGRLRGLVPAQGRITTHPPPRGAEQLQADYAAAEREYTEALALKRWSSGMHYERASARIGQENWRGALEDLNEAIRLRELHHPGDPDYYELRAVALEALGLRDRAEKDRARAAELRGQSPEADAASQPATDSQPAATEPADSF